MIIILGVLECIRIGTLKWYIIIQINPNPKRTQVQDKRKSDAGG